MVCSRRRFKGITGSRGVIWEEQPKRISIPSFLKKALRMCINKPLVLVDKGPRYRWAFDRLGLEYRHERFFRYLKERTVVFHHKLSARDHVQGNKQPKAIPKPVHNILPGREGRRW
jgi:hypothetical protein